MIARLRIASLALVLCALPMGAHAQVIHPWEELGSGFTASLETPYWVFPALAVASTPPLVFTLDEPVQRYFQRENPLGATYADVTLGVGWVAPAALPGGLYVGGLLAEDDELATAGAAALQAAAVQAVVVTALKWLTDRKGPYPDGDPTQTRWSEGLFEDSKSARAFDFNPFTLSGGLRWPSGHTSGSIAVVSALFAFYPDQWWIGAVGYPASLGVGVGMLEGDYHWLSDVVAGALLGHAIGWTIGRSFRERFDARKGASGSRARNWSVVVVPRATDRELGATLLGSF